jgi:hypothetical protein
MTREQDEVAAVLESVMLAMAARDVDGAHQLFAAQAQGDELRAQLEQTLAGISFVLYSGYSRLELWNVTIGVQSGTEPAEPSGIVAHADGIIEYSDGYTGTFDATLVKEQDQWRLWSMNIQMIPERLDEYSQRGP